MLNRITKADLYRQEGLIGVSGFLKGIMIPGFRYTYIHRKSEKYKNNFFLSVIYRFLKRRYKRKYGFEISAGAEIGDGFYMSSHSGHIIIGPIKIGNYCSINHCVTIGRSYKNGKIGRPVLGDFVWVGTGAVIVGDIKIGNRVLIAPNAFVNINVPDNSLVIGNPAKIISKENPVKYYINHIWTEYEQNR